mmetsp:Transcript_87808/g.204364  ORF Transcript_87808/g.204364 Transcript_87808/m.204364 type:complete len:270 (+) Transcript_87808:43-852(+)
MTGEHTTPACGSWLVSGATLQPELLQSELCPGGGTGFTLASCRFLLAVLHPLGWDGPVLFLQNALAREQCSRRRVEAHNGVPLVEGREEVVEVFWLLPVGTSGAVHRLGRSRRVFVLPGRVLLMEGGENIAKLRRLERQLLACSVVSQVLHSGHLLGCRRAPTHGLHRRAANACLAVWCHRAAEWVIARVCSKLLSCTGLKGQQPLRGCLGALLQSSCHHRMQVGKMLGRHLVQPLRGHEGRGGGICCAPSMRGGCGARPRASTRGLER